jgi:nucleotide-binding universal stress UspA family protein
MSGRRRGPALRPSSLMFRTRGGEPPDAPTLEIRRVLLATEGRAIPPRAIEFAVRIAQPARAPVHVFSIARVWGTSFGLPNPGLLPTRRDWDEQRTLVDDAVKALERRGIESQGRVLATRKATKRIVREAERLGCDAIVMAADPPRNRFVADLMWSQEPYRVRRRARVPVYLVSTEG